MTEFSRKQRISFLVAQTLSLSMLLSMNQAQGQRTNFIDESSNMYGKPDPNSRFVVLNSGIASMAAQQFGLPKETMSFPIAGMTVFPYYQASAPLKEFLNNSMLFGMPINQFPTSTNLPQVSLPATDLIRRSVPIPSRPFEKSKSSKIKVVDKKIKDEVPWMVAHEGGQAFQIPGDSEAIALLGSGSMFSACAARTMVLRCGVIWIFTGARPCAVLTKDAAVVVKPHSIAAVETSWYNRLRVVSLQGAAVELQLAYEGSSDKLVLEKGHELVVEESACSLKNTPSKDAVASNAVGAGSSSEPPRTAEALAIKVPGLRAFSEKVNPHKCNLLAQLASVNPPFTNTQMAHAYSKMFADFGISPAMRREEIRRQSLEKHNLASKTAINNLAGKAEALANSSASAPPKFPQASQELQTRKLAKGMLKCLSDTEIEADQNGNQKLLTGEAVFLAKEALVINTKLLRIHMRAGAMINVLAKDDVILVRNLGESEPDSVRIRLGNHIFDCGVGGELIAGSNAPVIFDEMKNDGMARRNLQSTESGAVGIVVNKCELSLTTLMQYSPLMRKIYKSQDSSDKKLAADLMKTIVAVNMVTGSHGNYRRMSGGLTGVH